MPEHVEPRRALRSGAEQARGREQPGKRQAVRDRDEAREQVAARQREERARAGDSELAEEQRRRDQVVDDQRGLIGGDEPPDLRERHLGERQQRQERGDRDHHDAECQAPLKPGRCQRRKQLEAAGDGFARHCCPSGANASRRSLRPCKFRAMGRDDARCRIRRHAVAARRHFAT
jgi:hypothetical protein